MCYIEKFEIIDFMVYIYNRYSRTDNQVPHFSLGWLLLSSLKCIYLRASSILIKNIKMFQEILLNLKCPKIIIKFDKEILKLTILKLISIFEKYLPRI